MTTARIFGSRRWGLLVIGLVSILASQQASVAQLFSTGDVFVAVGNASVQWRRSNGVLVQTLVATNITGNVFTTGMAFDKLGNLYMTMFDSDAVAKFDNSGNYLGTFGSGYDSSPESIVIDAKGNVYVGQADGSHDILKFDLFGNLLGRFTVDTEDRGSDWIDLAGDLCTMRYTSEGTHVKVFDVCSNQQLADLNGTALPGSFAYAHRLLANGDTLVANAEQIVRLNANGAVIQSYSVPGSNNFFALNLDPDGTSFWSGDLSNGNIYKFDLAGGNVLLQFNATGGISNLVVGGITVNGELTASTPPPTGTCITRNSRFWFTHAFTTDSVETNCATLLRTLEVNGPLNLGFLTLPVTFENADNVINAFDALMEALGFYWKGKGVTGENGGSQNAHLRGSGLCNARKQLSVELIAATANVELLGTNPSDCTYVNGGVVTNFPANLLQVARTVAGGSDPVACKQMTALLRKFNNSGSNNNFTNNLVECSPNDQKSLKDIARDPTTQFTCPGLNDNCASAQEVFFQAKNPPFSKAKFTASANFDNYPTGQAFWKISQPTAATNRSFRVSTDGSNIDTILNVLTGTCALITSNGTTVVDASGLTVLATAAGSNRVTQLSFTTDGTNTFFIQATPSSNAFTGTVKIRVTSP